MDSMVAPPPLPLLHVENAPLGDHRVASRAEADDMPRAGDFFGPINVSPWMTQYGGGAPGFPSLHLLLLYQKNGNRNHGPAVPK